MSNLEVSEIPVEIKLGADGFGQRVYGIKNQNTGDIIASKTWNFFNYDISIAAIICHDKEFSDTDSTGIQINKDESLYLFEHIGLRELDVYYTKEGRFDFFEYQLHTFRDRSDFPRSFTFKEEGSILADGIDPYEFEFDNVENETRNIKRVVDGKVVDEMIIPSKVNINDLIIKFAPEPLVRNPQTPDQLYDVFWKDLDPVFEAGVRWDALENDQYDSLPKRIPKPARNESDSETH